MAGAWLTSAAAARPARRGWTGPAPRWPAPGVPHRLWLLPRRDGRLDRHADCRLPGPRRGIAHRVRRRRTAIQSPAAAAAGHPRPHPGRLLRRGRHHRSCALRDFPVPHLLHAAGQGIQPADHRAAVPAAGRRDPGCLDLVQRRALPRVGPRPLVTAGMLLAAGGIGLPGPAHRDLQLPRRCAARPAPHGPGFRPDLRAGGQHGHGRGVPRQDSGVASALVNTMQQVGGSIGISVLSTIAASAATRYFIAHHTGRRHQRSRRPTATAWPSRSRPHCWGSARSLRSSRCPHGTGLTNSLAKPRLLLPGRSQRRPRPPLRRSHQVASALHPAVKVMPVGLLCCSPVIDPGLLTAAARPSL